LKPEAIERAIAGLPDDLLRQRPEDLMLEEFALIAKPDKAGCLNDELPAKRLTR